ncbi:hypothetical protein GCM10007981_18520 [Thermocladium modestius]|uniref:Uncharacterized protein n=2 Tax=Thermocladium modestius TaxID=62609 RepID=A0A830GVR5_9CREN|nr:hypothetical protein GCM10007981_18520 [Thermocladium modestius]
MISIIVLLGISLYLESQPRVVFIYYGPNYVVRYVKPTLLSRLVNGLDHVDPPVFPSISMQVNGVDKYYNLSLPITNASLYAFAVGPAPGGFVDVGEWGGNGSTIIINSSSYLPYAEELDEELGYGSTAGPSLVVLLSTISNASDTAFSPLDLVTIPIIPSLAEGSEVQVQVNYTAAAMIDMGLTMNLTRICSAYPSLPKCPRVPVASIPLGPITSRIPHINKPMAGASQPRYWTEYFNFTSPPLGGTVMGYWFVASPVGVEARLNGLELGIGMNRGVLASGQSNVTLSVSVTGPLVLDAPLYEVGSLNIYYAMPQVSLECDVNGSVVTIWGTPTVLSNGSETVEPGSGGEGGLQPQLAAVQLASVEYQFHGFAVSTEAPQGGNYTGSLMCWLVESPPDNPFSARVNVSDPYGAGWEVMSSVASVSGNGSVADSVVRLGGFRDELSAVVTKDPPGKECVINPSSVAVANGSAASFTVSCVAQPPKTGVSACPWFTLFDACIEWYRGNIMFNGTMPAPIMGVYFTPAQLKHIELVEEYPYITVGSETSYDLSFAVSFAAPIRLGKIGIETSGSGFTIWSSHNEVVLLDYVCMWGSVGNYCGYFNSNLSQVTSISPGFTTIDLIGIGYLVNYTLQIGFLPFLKMGNITLVWFAPFNNTKTHQFEATYSTGDSGWGYIISTAFHDINGSSINALKKVQLSPTVNNLAENTGDIIENAKYTNYFSISIPVGAIVMAMSDGPSGFSMPSYLPELNVGVSAGSMHDVATAYDLSIIVMGRNGTCFSPVYYVTNYLIYVEPQSGYFPSPFYLVQPNPSGCDR